MFFSTLVVSALALASPTFADEDDYRVSDENVLEQRPVLGRPPEWPVQGFRTFATCAPSRVGDYTMSEMTVDFTNSCADVKAEVLARAGSAANGGSWVDPHNKGHYTVLEAEGSVLKIQRYTGGYKYRNVITLAMTDTSAGGCTMNGCSTSMGNSNNDGGTNMCNMGDLFCNTSVENTENGVKCTDLKYNLEYTVPYLNCGRFDGNGNQYLQHNCQEFTTTCLKNPTTASSELEEAAVAPVARPVLGRPPEWPVQGFQTFSTCAASRVGDYTMSEMTVDFTNSCADVKAEVLARAGSAANGGSWVDPHNKGHYTVLEAEGSVLKIQRYTGGYKYRNVITLAMTDTSAGGCTMNGCSTSMGNSNNDGGTNMCNMGDLFCNTSVENTENGVKCTDLKYNLEYTVPYLNCGRFDGNGNQYLQHNCQEFTTTCLKNPTTKSSLEAPMPEQAPALERPVLGRPPEWPENNFDLFSTCVNSDARAHTMAEMTVDFTNSCSDVMTEMKARAGSAADGGKWVDPHNRGHYTVLATEGNLLKIQRYTQRYKYRNVITFQMEETAAGGCKVNGCSVSMGNSNNDGGTNMCNMADLFCNSSVKNTENGASCTDVKYNLEYTVPYLNCGRYDGNGQYLRHNCQEFTQTCLKNPSTAALEAPQHVLRYLFN